MCVHWWNFVPYMINGETRTDDGDDDDDDDIQWHPSVSIQ